MGVSSVALVIDRPFTFTPDIEEPATETEPRLQQDGWHYRFPWVHTAVSASPYRDELVIQNMTRHTWRLWHRFHSLDLLPPDDIAVLRLDKSGLLVARQSPPPPYAEHIMLDLQAAYTHIAIEDVSGTEGFYAFRVIVATEVDVQDEAEQLVHEYSIAEDDAMPIEDLGLSAKLENALKAQGIMQVEHLRLMGLEGVATMKGLCPRQRKELIRRLVELKIL